ncbi:MAG: reverse transcriptase family protein [Pirellulales bacterium]|nr:reverse transcriptase family protein [Pirellulales bacterium]
MLHIHYDKQLARMLGTTRSELRDVLDHAGDWYEILRLYDPAKPNKPRDVVNVRGKLRRLQDQFYRRVLLPKLVVSTYSHGGIRGRHVKSNAQAHLESRFVFKADISNFYPTIRQQRVYRLFLDRLKCTPPVAKLCTRLCTFDHHLALGLITSPILADQELHSVDERIGGMCRQAGLVYTRFVDDVTISGNYDLERSGIPRVVNEILVESGFAANPDKYEFGSLAEGIAITGVRQNRRGHLDVRLEYADEVGRQLDDAARLARGEAFDRHRPYYTKHQIRGRIEFVRWINRGRGERLYRKYRSICWSAAECSAHVQGLIASKKRVLPRIAAAI